ncbi:D-hexose-6-phosphate mutarotase [Pseudomonas cavernae]|uniref:Putative glucose-6-phosphate 1-epimerase n=1 Tax=Pseudomonas cavernae TaxID=2320867 RepID=A0A385Z9J5_9PSED|nr:D-hexose-6-phosphate mutarotase [Pseudomonas cavernae]AYC34907.1 D-hexose-6-phosphate mutarotase [Pseudomonas cavernae]
MYDETLPTVDQLQLGELACWRVHTRHAELLVAQQGAQVLSYQPHGQEPLIWLSEQADYQPGQSVRGGVPVCWPWFGDLKRNPATLQALYHGSAPAPAHGLVRGLDWELLGIDTEDSAVNLRFACLQPEAGLPGWPHAVDLQLHIQLDERLCLTLSSHNRGDQPIVLSQALHTYFAVSDIHQTRVSGLAGSRYIETLEGWQERQQAGDLKFHGETDRIYLDTPARLSILDPGWQRQIHLEASGSRSAVVWNPWIDKAQRLSQFASDAWQGMLCIETANVLDDVLHLAPNEQKSLAVSLWAEPLQE